jgi:hypothetical protein
MPRLELYRLLRYSVRNTVSIVVSPTGRLKRRTRQDWLTGPGPGHGAAQLAGSADDGERDRLREEQRPDMTFRRAT